MEVFVRSRWKHHTSKGYFWKPEELPILKKIESHSELFNSESYSIVLFARYSKIISHEYYLYITGFKTGTKDNFDRPIIHTILWKANRSEEFKLRNIILSTISNNLTKKLNDIIIPDDLYGFKFDENRLKNIGSERNIDLADYPNISKSFSDFVNLILHNKLPIIPIRYWFNRKGVFLLIISDIEYNFLKSISEFKYLNNKYFINLSKQ